MRAASVRRRAGAVLLACVLTALVGGLLAACNDPRDKAPKLEVAWTADGLTGWNDYQGRPWVASDDQWIYWNYDDRELTGVSLKDGTVVWHQPTGEVCALSRVNDAGLVAVQSDQKCSTITVVDTTTGTVRWTGATRVRANIYPHAEGLSIGLSDRTVTVSTCGIERWSLATGRYLGRLEPGGGNDMTKYCVGEGATTGSLAIVAGKSGLTGYDPDTGTQIWTRRGADAAVHRIYAADPLVADVALGGVRAVRTIDPTTGAFGPVLGRPLSQIGESPGIVVPQGDTVVGAYDAPTGAINGTYDETLRGWDATTGEERWASVDEGDDYLGASARGTFLGRTIDNGDSGGGYGYWVRRSDPGGKTFRTVGWIPDQVLNVIEVGDLLLTGGDYGRPTVAYRLPSKTDDVSPPPSKDGYEHPRWAKGDFRPDPRVDPCTGVSPSTLKSLGFGRLANLPAPLGCIWSEGPRQLQVTVDVAQPGKGISAADSAKGKLFALLGAYPYKRLRGIGDEAWVVSDRTVAAASDQDYVTGPTSSDVRLLVRTGNLVVAATYHGDINDSFDQSPRLPLASFRIESGVRAAVLETLKTAGDDESPAAAPPGADGSVTALPDVCKALSADVRTLLPNGKPQDVGAAGEDRLRGCRWQPRQYGPFVGVVAYAAAPGALTGGSAVTQAQAAYANSVTAGSRNVRDKRWQEGQVYAFPYSDTAHLTVRSGNVVLVVHVNLDSRGHRAGALAKQFADRLLDATGH